MLAKCKIKKPVIIIGCPRSGTTLLYTILSESRLLYSLYNESRFIFKKFYEKKEKENQIYFDDFLSESDLTNSDKELLITEFEKYTLNNRMLGLLMQKGLRKSPVFKPLEVGITKINELSKNAFMSEYRMVEKTPRNCLKIPFVNELFPDCKFIFLKRDGRSNISSLIEGWKHRKGGVGRIPKLNLPLDIKGYDDKLWRFILPPGWQEYRNKSLEEVCAFQWLASNEAVIRDLRDIPEERKYTISYEELIENAPKIIRSICEFIEIPYSKEVKKITEDLPIVNPIGGNPKKDKWKKNEKLIERVYPMIEPMMNELGYVVSNTQKVQYQKLPIH